MPVYNTARFLGEAIESILKQTFADFEFITISDGSTDASLEILHKYAAHDPRIRVVSQRNQGVSATFNRGIDLARGQYLARMDPDDVAVASRLVREVEFLDAQPNVIAVSGWSLLIDEEGDPPPCAGLLQSMNRSTASLWRSALLKVEQYFNTAPGNDTDSRTTCDWRRSRLLTEPTDDRDLYLRLSEKGACITCRR